MTSTAATGPEQSRTGPGTGIHGVYTQPQSLKEYRQKGKWPDGTVLIMEVRAMKWDDLPTGHVMEEVEPVKWLIMVKDAKGLFPQNPHWAEGWGWALFTPADMKRNVSADCKTDCTGCHEPAKATEWVFIRGYPLVR